MVSYQDSRKLDIIDEIVLDDKTCEVNEFQSTKTVGNITLSKTDLDALNPSIMLKDGKVNDNIVEAIIF